MSDAQAELLQAASDAYYFTSYSLGTGTTSTATLKVWSTISNWLIKHGRPITGAELAAATELSLAEIDRMFTQRYYERWYGFKRFDTLDAWQRWAEEHDVLTTSRSGLAASELQEEAPPSE